jgi:pimeloyl-ACP methyl ester carboxylesterase
VALHPTTAETIEPIAGVVGEPRQHLGLALAQRGFVVICPRCFLWQDVKNYQEAVDRFRERHPQTLGMHKMLYDAQRALDILAALPEVDAERIGAVGHSLGAKEALYLAAFDDRVKAAVASEGGLGLTSTNWDAPWYLGPKVRQPEFARNHHELVAMIAPRPFLVIGGESGNGAADGDRSWPYLQAARPIYELHTSSPAVGMLNHRGGHPLPLELFPRVAEWFEVYLAK